MWVIEMRETFEQARPARARNRKRWEIVAREEIHFQNFVVGVWSAARNFAEEDHFEGVMGGQRLAPSPIAKICRSPSVPYIQNPLLRAPLARLHSMARHRRRPNRRASTTHRPIFRAPGPCRRESRPRVRR